MPTRSAFVPLILAAALHGCASDDKDTTEPTDDTEATDTVPADSDDTDLVPDDTDPDDTDTDTNSEDTGDTDDTDLVLDTVPGPGFTASLAVSGGSFEFGSSPDALPMGWSTTSTYPGDSIVLREDPVVAGTGYTAPHRADYLRIASTHVFAAGEVDAQQVDVVGGIADVAVPGVTYTLSLQVLDDESCNWAQSGPDFGLQVGGAKHLTQVGIATLSRGAWAPVSVSYTATEEDRGMDVRAVLRILGNTGDPCRPEILVDDVQLTASYTGAFPVANGSFEDSAAGATPSDWSGVQQHPTTSVLRAVTSPDDDFAFTPSDGSQALRLATFRPYEQTDGEEDHRVSVRSAPITTAVEGRTYTIVADFHDPGSCNWWYSGPRLGFEVGSTLHGGYVSVLGYAEREAFVGGSCSWRATAADDGLPIRAYVDAQGSAGNPCRVDVLVDDVRVAATD
jgi:hypothetical protein